MTESAASGEGPGGRLPDRDPDLLDSQQPATSARPTPSVRPPGGDGIMDLARPTPRCICPEVRTTILPRIRSTPARRPGAGAGGGPPRAATLHFRPRRRGTGNPGRLRHSFRSGARRHRRVRLRGLFRLSPHPSRARPGRHLGHRAPQTAASISTGRPGPARHTVVVLHGHRRRRGNLPPDDRPWFAGRTTPAAVVRCGTMPGQRTVPPPWAPCPNASTSRHHTAGIDRGGQRRRPARHPELVQIR